MDVKKVMISKPAMRFSIGGMVVGAGLLAVGLIAIFGRFHRAHALLNKLGFKAAIGIAGAGGGIGLVSTVALIANRVLKKKDAPPPPPPPKAVEPKKDGDMPDLEEVPSSGKAAEPQKEGDNTGLITGDVDSMPVPQSSAVSSVDPDDGSMA